MIDYVKNYWRQKTAKVIVASLFLSLFTVFTSAVVNSPAHALTTCAIGSSAQNSLTVEPSHPTVMYIDSGVTPRIDASYVGYRIKNTTGSTLTGYWASLDNFGGNVVSLVNPLDKYMEIPELANNASTTVYFLLKATGATKVAQTHDFKIFNKKPDASTASNRYGCTFSFAKVAETIKASANKLDANYPTVSTIGAVGTTFTVVAKGATGTIGAGNPDVGRILWFTPTAYSNFPTRAFRLESVDLKVADNNSMGSNGSNKLWLYNERLFVKTTTLPDTDSSISGEQTGADDLVGKRYYENTYTFRVIGKASGSVAPISQISSGTQIKHQAAISTAAVNSTSSTLPITIAKTVDTTTANMSKLPTTTISGNPYIEVPYKVTLTNSSASVIRVDQVVDNPPSTYIYKSGSSQIKIGSGSLTSLANPETLTAESSISPQPLHFFGPFEVPANSTILIYYKNYIRAVQGTYTNSVTAYVGDSQITSTTSAAIPAVTVTVNETGTATTYETKTVTLLPDAVTTPASSLETSTATINGTIDINNDTRTVGVFEWGTSSSLASYTTIDLGTISSTLSSDPISKSSNLTGLSANSTYFYRIVAKVGATRYEGQILSFTTLVQKSPASVTTDPPTGISSSDATLNATVSANLNSVSIQFLVWKSNDTATVKVVDDPTAVYNSSSNPYSVFSGGFSSPISINMTDAAYAGSDPNLDNLITANATVYYLARIVDSTDNSIVLATGVTRSFSLRTYVSQTITFASISNITWGDAAPTINPTASSGLTVTRTSNTPEVCTIDGSGNIVIVKAGDCSISANQDGGPSGLNYYNAATEVTQSFTILPKAITVTAADKTKQFGDSDPTLTYSVTGSLVGSDTFTGTISRTSGEALGTYTINQNSLSLSANYSLTYVSANLTITKRLITITAAAKTKVYGEADPDLTYSVTSGSLASGDAFSGSLTRAAGSNVGTYAIDSGTVNVSSNYTITYVGANFTITKKSLAITIANKTKQLNAADPTFTYSITTGSLVGSDTLTGTLTRQAGEVVGNYTIETGTVGINSPADLNYNFSVVTGTLTISNKIIPSISWPNPSSIVYGTLLTETPTAGNQLQAVVSSGGTTLAANCVYSPAAGTKLAVGTHTLSVTCTPTDPSYEVVSTTVSITVTGKPITVKATSKTKTYGDSDPTLEWSITSGSLETGETLTGTLLRVSGEDVGSYLINQNTLNNANYLITYQSDSLTITTKTLTITITAPDKEYDRDTDTSLIFGSLVGVISADSGLVEFNSGGTSGVFGDYNSSPTAKTITLTLPGTLLTGTKAGNYTLSTPSAPTAKINKAVATVTAANKTVTAGDAIGSISYSVTGLIAGDSGDPFTGITCTSDYTTSDDSTTVRYTRCSGGTATNYTPTFIDGTVTIVDASTTTYSVTYTAGAGGGTPPTESNKPAGASITLPSGSSLSRSGYSFAGWKCASSATQDAGTTYTMPASALTCVAQWTQNASSGGNSSGTGNATSAAANAKPTPTVVRKSATLVTLATTPVKSAVVVTPVRPSTSSPGNPSSAPAAGTTTPSTPAPGNSGNTPSTGGSTSTPSTPAPGNSGNTPSTGGTTTGGSTSTPSTPAPGNSGNTPSTGGTSTGGTSQRINVNNTQLSQTTTIAPQAIQSVTFKGAGITQVNVVNNEVAVQARAGFSGKTTVTITVTNAEEVSTITADVIVIPLPVTNPVVRVVREDLARIQWVRSPNAVTYEVTQNGRLLCTTSSTICTVSEPVSATAPVQIKALGRDQTESIAKQATYVDATVSRVIPEIALVVNFDTAKYNLDAEDRKLIRAFAADVVKFGFKEVDISGHTDSRGGIDNNVLSNNRAKSARAYLLSLVPNLKVTINGFADAINVAPNTTAAGLAANRRAEFRVVG